MGLTPIFFTLYQICNTQETKLKIDSQGAEFKKKNICQKNVGMRLEKASVSECCSVLCAHKKSPTSVEAGLFLLHGCLAVTYFRMGNPHYHRRWLVSRSCSGWEGVGPSRYGRQA